MLSIWKLRGTRVGLHALLAVLSGIVLAYAASALVLHLMHPSAGFADLGWAITAVTLGYPIGVLLGTILWAGPLHLSGSKRLAIIGTLTGFLLLLVFGITSLMQYAQVVILLFVLIFPLLILGCYHYRAR